MLVSEVQAIRKKLPAHRHYRSEKRASHRQPETRNRRRNICLICKNLCATVLRDKQTPNPKLWRGIEGYLELLASDKYAAEKRWDRLEDDLDSDLEYDKKLLRQLEIWRCLLEIIKLDLSSDNADNLAFRIRSYEAFKWNSNFEPFLQQWLSAGYAAKNHPG
jgi:hypothetical protein